MSRAGRHAWEKLWGWELLLLVTVVVPVVFALLGDLPAREKAIVACCLLAILPLYAFMGRPAIAREDRRTGLVYLALVTVLYTVGVLHFSETTFTLFGLCPQWFFVLPARRAVFGVVALSLPPALVALSEEEPVGAFFDVIVILITAVFFSTAFGIWVERITQQSQERAELIEQLEATRAELARLSAERGAQEERERLAGEIHDTLAQGFSSIIMLIQAAQTQADPSRHLALAVQTAKENLAEARALISALTPAPLESSSLVEAMRRIAARTGEELGAHVGFEVRGAARPLPTRVDIALVRALQEGLANVRKHAAAREVRVVLEYGERLVRLEVGDDGAGFDPGATEGFGLRTMQSRVAQAGGTLQVRSAVGEGTTVTVEVPA